MLSLATTAFVLNLIAMALNHFMLFGCEQTVISADNLLAADTKDLKCGYRGILRVCGDIV